MVLFVLALAQLIKKKGGDEFVELLYKIKYYLLNDKIKCLFRRRFLEKINEIDEDSNKIEIVSHSFGTILTIDYIANIQTLKNKNFKFISLGSPISFLSMRSQKIKKNLDELKILLANEELTQEWTFVYCKTDWLCPDLPEENMSNTLLQPIFNNRFTPLNIEGEESIIARLSGKPHMKYFYSKKVIEEIVLGNSDEKVDSFKKENRD